MAAILAVVIALVGLTAATTLAGTLGRSGEATPNAADPFRPYLVRLAEPGVLLQPGVPEEDLVAAARLQQRDMLAGRLDKLQAAGTAGAYGFDETIGAFRAELSEAGAADLASSFLVASVEPWPEGLASSGVRSATATEPLAAPSEGIGTQSASLGPIAYVQVYSPFVWGRVSNDWLSNVDLVLEAPSGDSWVQKGVPRQSYNAAPNNKVQRDPTQLYWETYFVRPNYTATVPVMIAPGDRVRVSTWGIEPVRGQVLTYTEEIVADDIRAWTSYEQDTVSGSTNAPPGSTVIVTQDTLLSVSRYLTAQGSVKYAELTLAAGGNFSVNTFRTPSDPTYKAVDLKQGSTGFVRVLHPGGNEVYTVHGQNALVLENSGVVHGYAFSPPSAPNGPDPGVTVPRTAPEVVITLRKLGGTTEIAQFESVGRAPYKATLVSTIVGGDTVDVQINNGPVNRVTTEPLTGTVELATNQVTGHGPIGKTLTAKVGQIEGYIADSFRSWYQSKQVTPDGAGNFASDQFQCGSTTNYLALQPGSFGFVGYEDARGNFIYSGLAAPTNHVMAGYPYLEGWVANGALTTTVTVRDAGGNQKFQTTAGPMVLSAVEQQTNDKYYYNTYYQELTPQFIMPGDTVTVVSGDRTSTIPVDQLAAYVNVDADIVTGQAPVGTRVRVIPHDDRAAVQEVVADGSGNFSAANPFRLLNYASCTESTKTEDFTPGDAGRVYVRHGDDQVFATYGRSLHVHENTGDLEIYPFLTQNVDWFSAPTRPVTATLTKPDGAIFTTTATSGFGQSGYKKLTLPSTTSMRIGDTISVAFAEGPNGGPTNLISVTLPVLPLLTASPDNETNTLGGVRPRDWSGRALLNASPAPPPVSIAPGTANAYGPLGFVNSSGAPIALGLSANGTVSFSNSTGGRIWVSWAVTGEPVRIDGFLTPGTTQVCGTAPAGSIVRIHDVTTEGQDLIIGTSTSPVGTDKKFCVEVSPLVKGQVVAAEANGTWSPPKVVNDIVYIYIPMSVRSTGY